MFFFMKEDGYIMGDNNRFREIFRFDYLMVLRVELYSFVFFFFRERYCLLF